MGRRSVAGILAISLALGACGQTSPSTTPSTAPSATAEPASPTPSPVAAASATPAADLPVSTIPDLPDAVVQITREERYRDPVEGWRDGISHGSGFIIDPAGIVLTNHHVVSEADTVTVHVGKDRAEYQGRVVSVAECSDLAVVQLEGGDRFSWLDWFDGTIETGIDVFAAGFPRGDPVYTLTGGIISRDTGVISEDWAWVDQTIEHDANILGGSSGGPVVTKDARVVAINYAGNDEERRSIAISRDEILPLLPDLMAGTSKATLGINGRAILPEANRPDGVSPDLPDGIWVMAVDAESPAAAAGIMPGDVLTELDGQALENGTMEEYCAVLRARTNDEAIPVTVYRPDDEQYLTAAFNGDPIEPPFAFATTLGGQDPTDQAPSFQAYDQVADAGDQIRFDAPDAWFDVVDRRWSLDGTDVGPGVVASIDSTAFLDRWDTAGVFVGSSETLGETMTVDSVLDTYQFSECTFAGRSEFVRGGWVGSYDVWEACGDTSSRFLSIAATPEAGPSMVYLQFLAPETADFVALDRVLTSLETGAP